MAHVPLPTAREAAAADTAAREAYGVSGRVFMESAGRCAALVLHRLWPEGRIVGVAGGGNNGGDLLVMLRLLHAWGRDVHVIAASSTPPDLSLLHGFDIAITDDRDEAAGLIAGAGVLVDGMLGTGASGAPRGRFAEYVRLLNEADAPVLALDLPSGVDADSGRVAGDAVRAAVTVTFGWPKLGLMLQPARACCGRLVAVEIGFPPQVMDGVAARVITPDWARSRVRPRAPDAHKGTAGRLLVVAGSEGMAGAAVLAAGAAIRAGAGLVRVASPAANRVILQTRVPEATFLDAARLGEADVEPMHAIVAGPGLGTEAAASAALDRAVRLSGDRPLLLDADALNQLAADTGRLRDIAAKRPLVITPHAAELSRLTGVAIEEILSDMPAAARNAAREFGCVVLLKGQPSLVAAPDGALYVNAVGSSDVATAGMGDQLAGVIGALLAGGAEPLVAACAGLLFSGRAADLAGLGRSLTPQDVSLHLSAALAAPGADASPLGLPFVTFDQPPRR